MQARGRGTVRPPLGIAFDGDLGNRVDAILAVSMLNGFASKGEARQIALCVSRPSLESAQLAEVVAGFYAGRQPGRGGAGAPIEMIGVPDVGRGDEAALLASILSRTTPDGRPQYTTSLTRLLETPDSAVHIRNKLLAQNDGNATVVLAGSATGLARMLSLYGSLPQISVKVRQLVVAIGAFPSGTAEPSVKDDVAGARKLFAEWPTPIVAVGSEVGAALPYPASSIETDFTWAPAHPVVDAFRALKPTLHATPWTALAAMLYAVRQDEAGFTLSEPGTISVLDDGRTQFTAGGKGTHRYLIADPAQTDKVIKAYRDMASAQPVQRPGRRGGEA